MQAFMAPASVPARKLDDAVRDRLAAGDVQGATSLAVQALGPEVLRCLRNLLASEDEAWDAFSQFSEDLWRNIATWRGEASFRTWAMRIAINAARDTVGGPWRRRRRRLQTREATALVARLASSGHRRVEEQRRAVDALRLRLRMEDRTLVALRVDQELSWDEIARVLSPEGRPLAPNTLVKRFERVKAKLARMARAEGLLP
jgi:RNA polymerase sigma-70 factor, ECF subfamily